VNLQQYDSIYFLGIGGIGMSALARWFRLKGWRVAGYDRTATALTYELLDEGIEVHFEDRVELLPGYLTKEKTLVVFTPAIPKDHQQHLYLQAQGFTILKRSEVLGLLTKNYRTIAVAGTHGKTTTSSMIAHLLKSANRDMVAFLGGITTNYNSNLVMHGNVSDETWVVAEADEFDRSFLRLFPQVAVVTSADADHLDIYGDHASMLQSYRQFMAQVKPAGKLIIHDSIRHLADASEHTTEIYGIDRGQFFASNVTAKGGFFEFDLHGFGEKMERVQLGVPGFHNIENAVAAACAVREVGLSLAEIRQGLGSFRGVKRRFEFVVRHEQLVFVDDYAHHPTEIEAFLRSLKAMYPSRKLTVAFQPHLFTRTRDFADGFSASLSLADEVIVLDIYPARELPIEGVSADMLMAKITSPVKLRCKKEELLKIVAQRSIEVFATVGAGDIDTLVNPLKELLIKNETVRSY
jgi:UDP-N-acetylmuramate--alanine ligase